MKSRRSALLGCLIMGVPMTGLAESFVHPLAVVPQPNAALLFDTSVTMGISSDCTSCHNPGSTNTRLHEAKQDILATMPLFRNYFVFGGVQYEGCGFAHVEQVIRPTPTDPSDSYSAVRSMINGLTHCGSRENFLPGGSSAWTNCILPTPGPACDPGDVAIAQRLLPSPVGTGPDLAGFTLTVPVSTSTICGRPGSPWPSYDVQARIIARVATGSYSWPRWSAGSVSGGEVQTEFCDPIEDVLTDIRNELNACLMDPTAFWDLSFLDSGFGGWCNPGTIAGAACSGGSPFAGTCVCNQDDPQCMTGIAMSVSPCGLPLTWKARQQIGICSAYDNSSGQFGEYYQNQADNVINGFCRENVAMFFTDGYMGDAGGVVTHSNDAQPFYRSVNGQSNMFVFHVSNQFDNEADQMMRRVSNNAINNAYDATNQGQMIGSFAKVLSRIYKGVYTGAPASTDAYETRMAVHSFSVPGYNGPGAPVSDDYLGWPGKISYYEIFPDGSVNTNPLWETDWTTAVNGSSNMCPNPAPFLLNPANFSRNTLGRYLGPGPGSGWPSNNRFGNNVERRVNVPPGRLDRDGDGRSFIQGDMDDAHPNLRLGYMYSQASNKPLIVGAPREAPSKEQAAEFGSFLANAAVRNRPQMIYTYSNGYVHGFHAGTYDSTPRIYGATKLAFSYDDTSNPAGQEMFRYVPSWINDPNAKYADSNLTPVFQNNNYVQLPITTGQLVAREALVDVDVGAGLDEQFRTLLLGNQGKEGRGYFSMDVSDPCGARVLAEWQLPVGEWASTSPELYTLPMTTGQRMRPVVITTGGLDGAPRIRAWDVMTGTQLASRNLPSAPASAPASYATGAVCVDGTGEGRITQCYALRTDGLLVKIPIVPNGFGAPQDVTPAALASVRGPGLVFATRPVAYFGADGAINLAFGSGDYENLVTVSSTQNYLFKVVDDTNRNATGGSIDTAGACSPTPTDPLGSGRIALGTGERVVAPPVVAKGVVAWTTYISQSNGCSAGQAMIYAMNYKTCRDALDDTNDRPQGQDIGDGIPTEPLILRRGTTLMAQTSATPKANQAVVMPDLRTKGGDNSALMKLYWRPTTGTY